MTRWRRIAGTAWLEHGRRGQQVSRRRLLRAPGMVDAIVKEESDAALGAALSTRVAEGYRRMVYAETRAPVNQVRADCEEGAAAGAVPGGGRVPRRGGDDLFPFLRFRCRSGRRYARRMRWNGSTKFHQRMKHDRVCRARIASSSSRRRSAGAGSSSTLTPSRRARGPRFDWTLLTVDST